MPKDLTLILGIALIAPFGALSRYFLSLFMSHYIKASFMTVFVVNMFACFAFGLIYELSKNHISATTAQILLVGFIGSFGTFGSYILDLDKLWLDKSYGLLFFNAFGQIAFGWITLYLGILAVRYFIMK